MEDHSPLENMTQHEMQSLVQTIAKWVEENKYERSSADRATWQTFLELLYYIRGRSFGVFRLTLKT